jgi:hypothetical protein
VNDFSGGIVYELFWCGLAAVIWPRKRVFVPVVWVFLITSLLEVLQLWDLQCLRTIRSWFIGRALIGNTFSWLDFPHYLAGCWLAFFIIRLAKKTPLPPPDTALEEIVA